MKVKRITLTMDVHPMYEAEGREAALAAWAGAECGVWKVGLEVSDVEVDDGGEEAEFLSDDAEMA